jgi:hypothetical protein
MALHVTPGDAVRDALIADGVEQPIEDDRGIVPLHGGDHTVPRQTDPTVIDEVRRASHLADATHPPDRSTQIQLCSTAKRWIWVHGQQPFS